VLLPGWQAVADRRAGARVPGRSAGCEDLAQAWMRSPQEGSYRMIAVAGRTGAPAHPPQPDPLAVSPVAGASAAAACSPAVARA